MGAIHLIPLRLALALVLVPLAWSCAGGDDDTLAPLPIAGGTVAGPDGSTVPGVGRRPATTMARAATPTVGSGAPSVPAPPVADWDGARYDVGVIESVSTLGAYSVIELDRWSYTRADGQTVDAADLEAEPVVGWWRTSPFSNVRVQTRTFVLAPDVEVLTLDPAGRRAACADPVLATPPAPSWIGSGTSGLGSMAATDVAVLTYSATGLVTRIRLTRGC